MDSAFPRTMSKIQKLDKEYKEAMELTYFEREQAGLALKAEIEILLSILNGDLRYWRKVQDMKAETS